MRGRKEIMRGMGGGTEGQATATTNTTTASSAPIKVYGAALPPAMAAERGRSPARSDLPKATASTSKLPDYSPVDLDAGKRRNPIGPMRREEATVAVPAPTPAPRHSTHASKRHHDTSVAAATSAPLSKTPFPPDTSIMTPNFEKNHIVRLPGKDKTKSKDVSRAEIDTIFRNAALLKGNRVGTPTRSGEVTKNTVYGFTPKKMERLHKTLKKEQVQRALSTGRPITITGAKVRQADFEVAKDPVFRKYKKRDINVSNPRRDKAEFGGTYRYPAEHLSDISGSHSSTFAMAKKKKEGSKKKKGKSS